MELFSVISLLSLFLGVAFGANSSITCVNGLYIVAARGGDPNNMNATKVSPVYGDLAGLGTVATALAKHVGEGSYVAPVPYSACPCSDYDTVIKMGASVARQMIIDYVGNCSSVVTPRIAVLGYSEGAQAISTALAGGLGLPNLGTYEQYIETGSVFGDPSYIARFLINGQSSANITSGLFAKNLLNQLYYNQTYGTRVRSWCTAGDFYCASGILTDPNLAIHHAEVPDWQNAALKFMYSVTG